MIFKMETFKELPVMLFESSESWHSWLDSNHASLNGVWLKFAKKSSAKTSITYSDALDEALCYGWIDSLVQKYDEDYYLQKFSPRKPKSVWSKRNVEKIQNLRKENRLKPSGIAAIDEAKSNGSWGAAYDSSSNITVPLDFQEALDKNPNAKEFFDGLNKTNKYSFYWRIQTAKKPETRKARIDKFIDMLNKGQKLI